LADHLQRLCHDVSLAEYDPNSKSLKKALARNANLRVVAPKDSVADGEVVFLATPFQANEATFKEVAEEFRGKILVGCTNPVGPKLSHWLNNVQSGSEIVQKLLPDSKVIKAFTIYGFENFEDSSHPGYNVKLVMMYCGNDSGAKKVVSELVAQLGWDPLDVGGLEQALHLERIFTPNYAPRQGKKPLFFKGLCDIW